MDTVKKKSKIVEFEDGSRHKVKRMRWKAMRCFMRKISSDVSSFTGDDGLFTSEGKISMSGLLKKLPELINESDELLTIIVESSSDMEIKAFDELDALEASAIIDAAIQVNFDEDLKNFWSSVAKRITGLMGTPTQPSDTQTPSSQSSMPTLQEMGSPQNT